MNARGRAMAALRRVLHDDLYLSAGGLGGPEVIVETTRLSDLGLTDLSHQVLLAWALAERGFPVADLDVVQAETVGAVLDLMERQVAPPRPARKDMEDDEQDAVV